MTHNPHTDATTDLVAALESFTDAELRYEAANLTRAASEATHPGRARYLAALARIAAGVVHRRSDQAFQDIADLEDFS